MSEEKLHSLEELMSHQDRQIQDLSDMIISQGKDIDKLKTYVRKLEDKIQLLKEQADGGQEGENLSVSDIAARDKPPHY